MLDYSQYGVTLRLTIDKRRPDNNNRFLLRWCVTHKRKRAYYNTGIRLSENEFELLNNNSRKPSIKEIRDSLQDYYDTAIKKDVKELAEQNKFSFNALENKLKGAVICTVNDAFNAKIKELKEVGNIGNANIYTYTLNSITNYKGSKIKFEDVTAKWLNSYQKFMQEADMKYSSMGMYLRTLRAIFNDAIRKDLIKQTLYPFGKGKFEIPTGSGRNMALSIADVKRIAEYECKTDTLTMCRDMWLFSLYCNGANFGDICRFKFDNIENGEIYFYRKKTINTTNEKKEIIAPILEPMQKTIERWGNPETLKNNLIFPFCNGCTTEEQFKHEIHNIVRLTNKQIKIVTKALNLPDVSTYTARHSYATILAKNRVPESYISEQLGHANRTVTQSYFDNYSKEERINYNSILL
ncbi:conserved hypothetical protein [uncultured Paludibacter sp.]|nr:conserved hypothetical protein [uncultured Paludibacter sp.]